MRPSRLSLALFPHLPTWADDPLAPAGPPGPVALSAEPSAHDPDVPPDDTPLYLMFLSLKR